MSVRVYELAKKLKISSKELVKRLKDLHIEVKGHMSSLDKETAALVHHELEEKLKVEAKVKEEAALRDLQVKIPITVKELATKIQVSVPEVIKCLMQFKIFAAINQNLDEDMVKRIGAKFGYRITRLPSDEELLLVDHRQKDEEAELVIRPPVVTLMGHVDHGKTSLLDVIRKTKITEKEIGGITQHIGAYEVVLNRGSITFLDTPGHEAFTAMRARGANVTDIVVLVVAADDGVMPQTVEAINHAREAGTPMLVAINKIDLPQADMDRTKRQLSELGLIAEDWGGKTIVVSVSAKTTQGIDNLLEMILLETEMLELKANASRPAKGVIVESKISKGVGPVATVLVQNGTLHIGDFLVCGCCYGRIRAMVDDCGQRTKEAGPSSAREIFGLSDVPVVGDRFYVVEDEKKAKEIVSQRKETARVESLTTTNARVSLEQLYDQIKVGQVNELKVILKADVQGSVEALKYSLEKLSTDQIKLKIIHSQVGNIKESDIMLAAAANAIVIGFHVGIEPQAKTEAERRQIEVRLYQIIYEAINDIRLSLEGLLAPVLKEVFQGRAEVRQVFKISKAGNVAGCVITKGRISRDGLVRIFRHQQCIYEGKISSLKRFKDDVDEVREGLECGMCVFGFDDLQPEDRIECYYIEKKERKLV